MAWSKKLGFAWTRTSVLEPRATDTYAHTQGGEQGERSRERGAAGGEQGAGIVQRVVALLLVQGLWQGLCSGWCRGGGSGEGAQTSNSAVGLTILVSEQDLERSTRPLERLRQGSGAVWQISPPFKKIHTSNAASALARWPRKCHSFKMAMTAASGKCSCLDMKRPDDWCSR